VKTRPPVKNTILCLLTSLLIAISPTTLPAQETTPPKTADSEEVLQLEDFVVTGTQIRGVGPVGSQVIQINQLDIQDSGVTSTGALLATIPQFDGFATRPTPVSSGFAPTTPPTLRGLGPGATLSLLNGHRLVGIGTLSTVADPTNLPIAVIARVEVVADGASATYGSDAIGGVLNVVLRKDLNGFDARASVGFADGYTEKLYSLVGGKTWETGSILVGAQFLENTALFGSERSYITEDFTSVGGGDNRTRSTALPNVTVGGVTYGFNGTGFNTTPNLTSAVRETDLIPSSRKTTAALNWEQRVGTKARLFGDGYYGNLRTHFRISPAGDTLRYTINNTNPYFQTPVPGATSVDIQQGAYELLGQFHDNYQDLKYWGVSGGGEVEFSDKWSGRLLANYGHSHTEVDQDVFDNGAFAAAVASTDPATAYDPFTGRTSAATRATITDAIAIPGSTQTLSQITAAVNGSLFTLPGGDAKLAFGGEYRRETYEGLGINGKRSAPVTSIINSTRNVRSGYGEIFLPVVGKGNHIPFMPRLEFNAALRYDRYSDFGNTTNPKFGVNWEIADGLTLRGTQGKSFHAPSLADLRAIDDLVFYLPSFLLPGVFTPPGSSTPLNLILLAGGNPNLKPEKATTSSVGMDYKPTFAPGLRVNATYFDIDYTDKVLISVGYAFLNPQLTNQLVIFHPTDAQIDAMIVGLNPTGAPRFPTGTADILVDARRINLGGSRVKGVDFSVAYDFNIGRSKLVADIGGTHYLSKKSTTVPNTPPIDDLASTPLPTWRYRSHLGWQLDRYRANLFWSYVGEYNNVNARPVQRVKSFDPIDINFAYRIPGKGFGKNFEFQFDIQNIFDEKPPRLYSGNGAIDPASQATLGTPASPIGRMFQLTVKTEF